MLKKHFAWLIAAALTTGLFVTHVHAQSGSKKKEKPQIGPKIGSHVKDFSLKDQSGKDQKFSEMLKQGPVAVVFFRSADW